MNMLTMQPENKKKKKEKATKDAFGDLMKGQVDPNHI